MTIQKIQLEVGDLKGALAAAQYALAEADSPRAFDRDREDSAPRRANSMWLGSDQALGELGLERGSIVREEQLSLALQGRHMDGREVRRPGTVKVLDKDGEPLLDAEGEPVKKQVVNSYDLVFSVPKSVSVLWSQADDELRAKIEKEVFASANAMLEHLVQTRPVIGGEATAKGYAAALTLHVTARTANGDSLPAPQLHVHCQFVGVLSEAGKLRTPDGGALYKDSAMREAGAVARAHAAEGLKRIGFSIRARTGQARRYFEVEGVDSGLCDRLSGRSRDVLAWIAQVEARHGGKLNNHQRARGAVATRARKREMSAAQVQAWWDGHAQDFDFGPEKIAQLLATKAVQLRATETGAAPAGPTAERGEEPSYQELREVVRAVVLEQLWQEGPVASIGAVRSMAIEVAPIGLSVAQTIDVVREMQAEGELITLDGRRVTSRDIRQREQLVADVAGRAGERRGPALSEEAVARGVAAAEARLKKFTLDNEQAEAVELLTSGIGWGVLTGRAGTGKGPVLQAVAEAHRHDGWRVIGTALDGATAQRLGYQIGDRARNIEQLLYAVKELGLKVDHRTLIVIDEASKIGLRHWEELARLVDSTGARLIAVGDVGQIGAIECPGMLDVMIKDPRIETARLLEIRRHRDLHDPSKEHRWLKHYLNAIYDGEALEAINILRREQAITMHETRDDAMVALVDKWEQRRVAHDIAVEDSILLVYGSNEDVDLVNMLAQARRISNGEIAGHGVAASDRNYSFHVGDVVMMRESAYQPTPARPGGRRPERVENGTTGVVIGVDAEQERVLVAFDSPDGTKRRVTVDLGEMRRKFQASNDPEQRLPSLRLNYAGNPFPLQGATYRYVGSLWGHWSQRKEETYSGDARTQQVLDVHTDRESTGWEGTDDDRYLRLAGRLSVATHRLASITYGETRGIPIHVAAAHIQPIPDLPMEEEAFGTDVPTRDDLARATRETADALPPSHVPLAVPHQLGRKRLAPILERSKTLAKTARTLSDEALATQHREGHEALARLDTDAALRARELEAFRARTIAQIRRASKQTTDSHRIVVAHHEEELRKSLAEEAALYARERHPDQWLVKEEGSLANREVVARAFASQTELARRERERAAGQEASGAEREAGRSGPESGSELVF